MVLASRGKSSSRLKRIFFPNFGFRLGWPGYSLALVLMPGPAIKGMTLAYVLLVSLNLVDEVALKMPIAVIINDTSEKMMLTTLPEAYVIVRRMSYGEKLIRSGLATKFLMSGEKGGGSVQGELDIQTEEIAYWDFANLVVEHNLEDADNRPLNFKNKADVKKLSGPIGEEVGKIIDDFNNPEGSIEVKNS